jgi:hypothetical protein
MFGRRRTAREQSHRDKEWRSLVKAVTDPGAEVSDTDESRLRELLGGDRRRSSSRAPADMSSRVSEESEQIWDRTG